MPGHLLYAGPSRQVSPGSCIKTCQMYEAIGVDQGMLIM